MSIYHFENYKLLIRERMERLKETLGSRITYQNLAETCEVQKTYLSKVLSDHEGKAHLNSDQLHNACGYLKLNPQESDFCQLLLDYQRSSHSERRKLIRLRIHKIQQEHLQSASVISAEKVKISNEDLNDYFLDPFQQLAHLFLTLDHYQKHPDAIGRKLGISQSRLGQILKKLERTGIIQQQGQGYKVIKESLHLPVESPYYHSYRVMMRLRSLDLLQRKSREKDYSFSVLFSADPDTQEKIRQKFLNFLKDSEKLVQKAPAESVYQMNFDLVDWTD